MTRIFDHTLVVRIGYREFYVWGGECRDPASAYWRRARAKSCDHRVCANRFKAWVPKSSGAAPRDPNRRAAAHGATFATITSAANRRVHHAFSSKLLAAMVYGKPNYTISGVASAWGAVPRRLPLLLLPLRALLIRV